jgi:hypothetical protein
VPLRRAAAELRSPSCVLARNPFPCGTKFGFVAVKKLDSAVQFSILDLSIDFSASFVHFVTALSNLGVRAAQNRPYPSDDMTLCRCRRMQSLSAGAHSINPLSGRRCERYAISVARVFGKHRDGPQRYIVHQADLGHVPPFHERLSDDHQLTPA